MHLHLASGTEIQFLSLADTAQNQDEFTVYGSQAIYRVQREALFVNGPRGPWEPKPDLPDAWGSATTHFVDVVRGTVPVGQEFGDLRGDDGLRAMQVLEAVVASARTGQPKELPGSDE